MTQIEFRSISKSFGQTQVLKEIDLKVKSGEFLVLLGASGCGKSTLLRILAGLETPTGGSVIIGEKDCTQLHPRQRDIAMVFQNYALYPHMKVFENMALALQLRKEPKAQVEEKVREVAGILGIEELLHRYPRQLSGGQRQRVAMGRAIVRNPQVFLFDEPLSNLDSALRSHMRGEIRKLHRKFQVTTLYVTHDQIEAMTLADRVVVLNKGVIQQADTPLEIFQNPANEFVARFVGSPAMNFIEGEIQSGTLSLKGSRIPLKSDFSGKVKIGIRPDFRVAKPGEPTLDLDTQVDFVETLGADMLTRVRYGETLLTRKSPMDNSTREGQNFQIQCPVGELHLFQSDSGRRIQH